MQVPADRGMKHSRVKYQRLNETELRGTCSQSQKTVPRRQLVSGRATDLALAAPEVVQGSGDGGEDHRVGSVDVLQTHFPQVGVRQQHDSAVMTHECKHSSGGICGGRMSTYRGPRAFRLLLATECLLIELSLVKKIKKNIKAKRCHSSYRTDTYCFLSMRCPSGYNVTGSAFQQLVTEGQQCFKRQSKVGKLGGDSQTLIAY